MYVVIINIVKISHLVYYTAHIIKESIIIMLKILPEQLEWSLVCFHLLEVYVL